MSKNLALTVAGIIFAIVAIAHLLRMIFQLDVVIGTVTIPLWVSGIAFVVALFLSVWMMRAKKS